VKYSLTVKNNVEAFKKVTYAEVEQIGEKWIVTYFGPETDSGTTPTPTDTGSDF
jgi:hypothetical protein